MNNMNTISHADLFPYEAFPENPDDMQVFDDYIPISKNIRDFDKKIRLERKQLLGEDRNLTHQEEQELAVIIQEGIHAKIEAEALGAQYDGSLDSLITAGLEARHILVSANLLFALHFVRKNYYTSIGNSRRLIQEAVVSNYIGNIQTISAELDIEDRMQIAMMAMWEAANKFTPGKNARFSTYAIWHMHRRLLDYLASNTLGLHVQKDKLREYRKVAANDEFTHDSSNRKLHPEIILMGRQAISLEGAISAIAAEEETGTVVEYTTLNIQDVVPEFAEINADILKDEQVNVLRWILHKLLKTLSDREAEVIRLRYGLSWEGPMSCEAVGKRLSLSRQRINQIEIRALGKLREPYRKIYLEDFNFEDTITLPGVLPVNADGVINIKTNALSLLE